MYLIILSANNRYTPNKNFRHLKLNAILCGSLYPLKIQIQCRHITITAGGHNSRQVKFSVARIK